MELHDRLVAAGVAFSSTSDSEIIAALIASTDSETVEDAIAAAMPQMHGAYSAVAMTREKVVAFRDPLGLRPLVLGRLRVPGGEDRWCVASESCAFDIIGAELVRDVQPGEIVTLGRRRSHVPDGRAAPAARRSASSSTSTSRGRTRG